ncbi:unnamed protein product, partial [Mesorhabditis belari]|uniref:26S proteasome non-ATPase regulatory subunit 1 n=1 Tax=Mesorhabditis belari TaxID=2138241 RepID=A0AAF3EJC5_9BILA
MTLFLIKEWKKRLGGPQDPSAFLMGLDSERFSTREKEIIIHELDDWDVIIPTWFEIADYLPSIEKLHENTKFAQRHRAALLASKVSYCLGDDRGALNLALAAADLFQLIPRPSSKAVGNQDELYVNKMIEIGLDTYKENRARGEKSDEKLEALVNRIFQNNIDRKELRFVIGLALETRRVDMIEAAIQSSSDKIGLLTETVQRVLEAQLDTGLRNSVLDLLLGIFSKMPNPDFVAMCQCLIRLEKPRDVALILSRLHGTDTEGELMAYQLAFDLYENATQQFINAINRELEEGGQHDGQVATVAEKTTTPPPKDSPKSDESSPSTGIDNHSTPSPIKEINAKERIRLILSGQETIRLHMQFLIKNNHTDMLILKEMKDSVRTATAHNATLIANGFMHFGTTCDDFLRDNLEWIGKATNWNKFNAVATLGMIHRGHEANAMKLLDAYLPKTEVDQFGFKEGGALYALGLIHANHGNAAVIKYLRDQLQNAQASPVRHGACLGLGLAAMGTRDQDVYRQLRDTLYMDDAVTGEAAAVAMGLVMVGDHNDTVFQEMVQYAQETQHDKIQRGIRTGLSLLAFGGADTAEPWIDQLIEVKSNAVLRQSAVCMLAMAYAGTGNANVVRKLLAKVAADPNNDVKRWAVIGLGFVLSKEPDQCVSYTSMLVEHFNGHVRYGAAIALGIACAASANREAIALIEPLLSAKENFVRQGAVIALALIQIQHTEATSPKIAELRKTFTKMASERGEDSMTRFGAMVAQGIIDAGGRNVTVSLQNRNGYPDLAGVVGMFVSMQYWYWHSFTLCISLAFKPSCIIGLNTKLEMPKVEFKSNSRASVFAYPPAIEPKRKEEKEKVEAAILSITGRKKGSLLSALRPLSAAKKEKEVEKMDVDTEGKTEAKDEVKIEKKKNEPEPLTHSISNPGRVVKLQLKTLANMENARYLPLKPLNMGGIIMLRDTRPEEKEELVATVAAGGIPASVDAVVSELQPPAAFEIELKKY